MTLRINKETPDFTAETTQGGISFHDWTDGDDVVILPAVSGEAAMEKSPDGWETPLPYLGMVRQSE